MANLFAYSVTFSLICLSFSSSLIIFIRVILVPLCEGLMDIHLANGYISAIARPYTLPGAVFYVLRNSNIPGSNPAMDCVDCRSSLQCHIVQKAMPN